MSKAHSDRGGRQQRNIPNAIIEDVGPVAQVNLDVDYLVGDKRLRCSTAESGIGEAIDSTTEADRDVVGVVAVAVDVQRVAVQSSESLRASRHRILADVPIVSGAANLDVVIVPGNHRGGAERRRRSADREAIGNG